MARSRALAGGSLDGGALALVLIVVITVAGLAAGLLQIGQAASGRQAAATNIKLAFYTAESGLAEAYAGLMIGKTGNVGTPELPALLGAGVFWVVATEGADGTIDLTSTGMLGNGSAVLSLVVAKEEPSVATLGLFSRGALDLKAGSLIDGYDSEQGSYQSQLVDGLAPAGAGRVGSNGAIAVTGTVERPTLINGDLTPGAMHGVTVSGTVTVVGSQDPAGASIPLPPVALPDVQLQPGVTHASGVPLLVQSGERGIASLTVLDGAEVILQGPATLVLGSLKLWPQATLTFDTSGGRIDLHVVEALDLEPGSLVSTPGKDPSLVTIQVPGQTATPLRLGATGPFFGVIYAPEADLMVGGRFEVYGALLGASVYFGGPARLHFDHRLNRLAAEMALPRLLSWRIIELSNLQGAASADPFQFLGLDRDSLPSPSEAHADQLIHVEYEDLGGLARVYDGLESAFDWTSATAVTKLTRDGAAVDPEGPRSETALPTPLLDVVSDGDLSSSQVRDQVVAASPVSGEVLVAVAERTPPMESSDLKAIFEVNAPALDPPLKVLVVRGQMSSSDLKAILVLNSPLSVDILDRTMSRIPAMDPLDLQAVLDAQ